MSENKNDFSVLISLYYKEKPEYLSTALKSIWDDQYLKPDEIVIVKDGPLTDELNKIIDDFSTIAPVNIISLPINQGLGAALNIGLLSCKNEIVARMDSDDISQSIRFQKQINFLINNPEIDILSSWIDEFMDQPDNIVSIRKLPENHNEIYNYAKKRCPVNHPVIVFKKSAVIKAGGYLPFPLFEDYYLWARMLMSGAKFYNFQESLLLFRSNQATFKRRGGFIHSIIEIKMQFFFYKIGFISTTEMFRNIFIRSTVRLMPNKFRYLFYKHFLR